MNPIVSAYSSVQIVNVKHTDEENPDVSLERERERERVSIFQIYKAFPFRKRCLIRLFESRLCTAHCITVVLYETTMDK